MVKPTLRSLTLGMTSNQFLAAPSATHSCVAPRESVRLGSCAVAGEAATVQESEVAYPARKIEGAEQLIVGASLYFDYPTRNHPAVLLRSAEGEYTAFSRRCSHAGCSVEFDGARRC